jgi:predicted LPLAT superfamily acyltransferase
MVGLLGDRVTGNERSVRCRFMGEEIDFPSGPALLSRLLKAPAILCFGLHQGNGRYEIVFEQMPAPPAGRDHEALREWTQRYVERLEHHARRAPFNWFNFYDYWPAHEQAPAP